MTATPTAPASEPAPLTAADLADAHGWRYRGALAAPDAVMLGTLADWGIWPDDHAPSPHRPLGEQFARQIGAGEAVQHVETFDLIRAIAHAAYATGYDHGTAASAIPADASPEAIASAVVRRLGLPALAVSVEQGAPEPPQNLVWNAVRAAVTATRSTRTT
ncbi:hypothetical protein ACH3VR_23155 [Microbacterium sp. B2969]|uniref:Uncharacterized protein n=1 Tax=Microbacterium alkaliflavum TaxID=3248839 RepID=A0ABW7QEE4_9MICO